MFIYQKNTHIGKCISCLVPIIVQASAQIGARWLSVACPGITGIFVIVKVLLISTVTHGNFNILAFAPMMIWAPNPHIYKRQNWIVIAKFYINYILLLSNKTPTLILCLMMYISIYKLKVIQLGYMSYVMYRTNVTNYIYQIKEYLNFRRDSR